MGVKLYQYASRLKQEVQHNCRMKELINHDKLFRLLGKRMPTMKTCFEILRGRSGEVSILELGSSRSFSSGKIDTKEFNPDTENWDWGAGCFTAAIKILLPNCKLISVDPNPDAIRVSKTILDQIGSEGLLIQDDSTSFLNKTNDSYDLIYMDHAESGGGDGCAGLHRHDAGIILRKEIIKPDGLILIDDIQTPFNKGMYSIPFFKECGLTKLSGNSYQALFRKER